MIEKSAKKFMVNTELFNAYSSANAPVSIESQKVCWTENASDLSATVTISEKDAYITMFCLNEANDSFLYQIQPYEAEILFNKASHTATKTRMGFLHKNHLIHVDVYENQAFCIINPELVDVLPDFCEQELIGTTEFKYIAS